MSRMPSFPVGSDRAFSLTEVTFSLGLVAFTFVALLGLLSVSMNSGRSSTNDTVITAMALGVISDLRSKPFEKAASADPFDGGPAAASVAGPPPDMVLFFDREGMRLEGKRSDAVYELVLKRLPDAQTSTGTNGSINLLNILLEFRWPIGAKAPNTKTIYASVARY